MKLHGRLIKIIKMVNIKSMPQQYNKIGNYSISRSIDTMAFSEIFTRNLQ